MASAKHPRKKRSNRVNIQQYNAEKRERNIKHEIRIADKKLDKLQKRYNAGLVATPGRKKVWDDSRQNVIKVIDLPKKQGVAKDSERYNKLSTHIDSLKKMLR